MGPATADRTRLPPLGTPPQSDAWRRVTATRRVNTSLVRLPSRVYRAQPWHEARKCGIQQDITNERWKLTQGASARFSIPSLRARACLEEHALPGESACPMLGL